MRAGGAPPEAALTRRCTARSGTGRYRAARSSTGGDRAAGSSTQCRLLSEARAVPKDLPVLSEEVLLGVTRPLLEIPASTPSAPIALIFFRSSDEVR